MSGPAAPAAQAAAHASAGQQQQQQQPAAATAKPSLQRQEQRLQTAEEQLQQWQASLHVELKRAAAGERAVKDTESELSAIHSQLQQQQKQWEGRASLLIMQRLQQQQQQQQHGDAADLEAGRGADGSVSSGNEERDADMSLAQARQATADVVDVGLLLKRLASLRAEQERLGRHVPAIPAAEQVG